MSSAVAELEAGLQAMLLLKPPGVSGSKIQSITNLCTGNVQSESVLIQKLYTHFKKAPATHKLGVLYVVDSVTRKWTELAKSAGQPINSSAQDGTFAAGVHKVKELLPALMNDITQSAPDDQKEKIRKLIDIWEKGQTFPAQMLNSFKEKLNVQNPPTTLTPSTTSPTSTTPPGSPPADLQRSLGLLPTTAQNPAPPVRNTSSILEALANMARQNTAAVAPANPSPPVPGSSYNVANGQSNPAQQFAGLNQTFPFPPIPPPVNVPSATFAPQGLSNGAQNFASNQTVPFAAPAPIIPPAGPVPNALQAQVALIQALSSQGYTPDQISAVITQMGNQGLPLPGAGGVPPPPPQFAQNQNQDAQNGFWGARPEESRDRNGFNEPVRSPPGRFRRRSRSRSPVRTWGARDSPNSRRHDDSYEYGRDSPARNRGDDRGRVRGGRNNNDYRQRSPPRRGRSPSPPRANGNGDVKKWVEHDPSIGRGNIKVLSRTLFVGGVTMPESELRSIFADFGQVQTCIVNKEKRHAFVKMISRADACRAKEMMEKNRTPDSQLRTRWGVGFGPRDCSDYQTGVSIIPISKLTDADRKWMLTAEYGGSGGQPIEPGLVVEEPDIEIGQGVSSKAISRRMQTDKGGNNGPKSSRDREEEERYPRRGDRGDRDDRRDDRRDDDRRDAPPSMPPIPPFGMPGFPLGMKLSNGMPFLPPGFTFPGQNAASSQSPAPGHNS